MITAAAPAFPYVRPSVTSVLGQCGAASTRAAVTCSYANKITIYNCRNSEVPGQSRADLVLGATRCEQADVRRPLQQHDCLATVQPGKFWHHVLPADNGLAHVAEYVDIDRVTEKVQQRELCPLCLSERVLEAVIPASSRSFSASARLPSIQADRGGLCLTAAAGMTMVDSPAKNDPMLPRCHYIRIGCHAGGEIAGLMPGDTRDGVDRSSSIERESPAGLRRLTRQAELNGALVPSD